MFFKFHIKLLLTNNTTIESKYTEHKKDNEKFNIRSRQNWEQVFGSGSLFWFFPFPTKRGRPEGDGLTSKTNENNNLDCNIKVYESHNKKYASNSYNSYDINFNYNNIPLSPGTK